MELLRTTLLWAIRILVAALLSSVLRAETIIPCPQQDLPLNQRWDWAQKEAQQQHFKNGYWVAYSIDRLMGDHEYYISGTSVSFDRVRTSGRPSLSEIILGTKPPEEKQESDGSRLKRAAKEALAEIDHTDSQEQRTLKPLAILFEFRAADVSSPTGVAILNMSLTTDLHKRPVLWLGNVENTQSLSLIQQLYASCANDVKEELLDGMTAHENSATALPFLQKVLLGDASDELRAEAASAIGQIDSDHSVSLLLQVCRNDRSRKVREEAVDALSEIRRPSARAALMELIKKDPSRELREEALDSIVEEATPTELEEIKRVMMDDPDQELQAAILYAIADRKDSTPVLIQAARTHKNHDVRETALHALADEGSDEAVEALNQIALTDEDTDLREEALSALGDFENGKGIPFVANIARKHPDKQMRLRAIEVLGDSDSKEARDALRKLLEE